MYNYTIPTRIYVYQDDKNKICLLLKEDEKKIISKFRSTY